MIKNNKIVLIIDDNEGVLKPLSFLLFGLGYTVRTAVNGMNSVIMQKPFANLILLDMRLHEGRGENGQDVCARIKEGKQTKHIKVIMFSADSHVGDVAKKSGADDFIAKPFSIANLVKKIEEYI